MRIEDLNTYEIIEKREIPDIHSMSYLLRHRKTGARVALLSNDDENKTFYIGFRTPPTDSTGVAHILEHSVLCGSREFPVKDPFVELVKGSMNTFLNAMTYPDKTVYPVASCNDKDFQNLMHVYLDAVFYPNIYENESIFRQEGWHYELDGAEGALSVNGVVYNEMKGAFSSPDDVLEREIMNSLYPDTSYGVESGGDPKVIPTLSYEQFLDFHRRYYHPSNSYIYLYGNMDMAEKLTFIDEHYLSSFDALPIDSSVGTQEAFDKPAHIVREFPMEEGEDEEENTFLSLNFSIGDSLDAKLTEAFEILDYALCSAPGAPLKQALVDAGLGKDVYSIYESGIKQPYFSIVAKDTQALKEQEFLATIDRVLKEIVESGLDEKALLAGINSYEFKYREADFGSYPKGLMYGLQMFDSWLYDDAKPFIHIESNAVFAELRAEVSTSYYTDLIQEYLLDNPHRSVVILRPKLGLAAEEEAALAATMAEKKASMSADEVQKVLDDFAKLTAWQESEDKKEDLAKIPLLTRTDLKKEATLPVNEVRDISGTKLLYHNIVSNGIGYLRLMFRINDVPEEYFPYIGLLKGCLGLLNTEHYSYGELFHETNLTTGGMSVVTNVYSDITDAKRYTATLEFKTKAFPNRLADAVQLIQEIALSSDFTDEKRLSEILSEGKSQMQAQMTSSGHSVAAGRAAAYGNVSAAVNELLGGIPFYRLTAEIEGHFAERKLDLTQKLQTLAKMIFRPENLMVDYTGDEGVELLNTPVETFRSNLYTDEVDKTPFVPVPVKRNEGFLTSGQVNYVCRAGNFKRHGLAYTGALRVLKVMMGYEYLWVNVRVKGGAYGCMCSFGRSGDCYFVSYRDPNLSGTVDIYEKAPEVIAAFEADERTMTQYIIGALSDLDTPMNPAAKGLFSLGAYLSNVSDELLQRERDELLATGVDEIRALSKQVEAFLSDEQFCVVGNAAKVKEEAKLFEKVENLF